VKSFVRAVLAVLLACALCDDALRLWWQFEQFCSQQTSVVAAAVVAGPALASGLCRASAGCLREVWRGRFWRLQAAEAMGMPLAAAAVIAWAGCGLAVSTFPAAAAQLAQMADPVSAAGSRPAGATAAQAQLELLGAALYLLSLCELQAAVVALRRY
jgi:hypothetical protein